MAKLERRLPENEEGYKLGENYTTRELSQIAY